MATSPRLRRVSFRQVEMLWEFLNSNRDIANAHNRSLHDKEYSQKKWKEIAEILNTQGSGTHKNWRGWSKYWVDYKAKLKIKLAVLRSSQGKNEGYPIEKSLTNIDQKFLNILGDPDLGLSGVRVVPLADTQESSASTDANMQDSQASESISQSLQTSRDPISQDPLGSSSYIPSPFPQLIVTPLHTTTIPSKSPSPTSCRRRRREMVTSRQTTRRALVRSSKMRAEAAVRTSEAIEKMVQHMAELQNTALRIERILKAAFPKAAEQENGI